MAVDDTTRRRIAAALERHARKSMRFGGDVLKQIEVTSTRRVRVWSAHLDTLVEDRAMRLVTRSAPADAEERAPARRDSLDPWQVAFSGAPPLQDALIENDVPDSGHVKVCGYCQGEKNVTCPACGGAGSRGNKSPCTTCAGTGLATCDACEGTGKIVELYAVEVRRTLDARAHVDRETTVPHDALTMATRDEVVHLDVPRIDVATFDAATSAYRGRGPTADPSFDDAVRGLLASAVPEVPLQIVRQRLVVRHVPVVEVDYDWRGDDGKLWLVGSEEHVFGSDMPLQGAFVSRTVAAAREKVSGFIARGFFSRLGKKGK